MAKSKNKKPNKNKEENKMEDIKNVDTQTPETEETNEGKASKKNKIGKILSYVGTCAVGIGLGGLIATKFGCEPTPEMDLSFLDEKTDEINPEISTPEF